jgi:hypothetical protein
MTSEVQGWLNNPASNFGWIAVASNEVTGGTALQFADAAGTYLTGYTYANELPYLSITYNLPAAVPEPVSCIVWLSLAGVSGLGMCLRRRFKRP